MIAGATTIAASPPACIGGHRWTLVNTASRRRREERRRSRKGGIRDRYDSSKLKVRRVGRIRPEEEEEALGWIRC